MSAYSVIVDGREYVVIINSEGLISVDGHEERIDIQSLGENDYSVLIGNTSNHVRVGGIGKPFEVLLQGNQVEVYVETERDRLLKQYAIASGTTNHRYEIHAPMPALVVTVLVQAGDEVQAGQGLIILEAMKMENEIKSHQVGKVKEVRVSKGKPVEKGELLMLLE